MEVREFKPDDTAAVAAFVAIDNARHIDAPWMLPATTYRREMIMRHGWDGETWPHFLGYADGEPVGFLYVVASSWDNPDLAWVALVVHPDRRRRGIGTALAEASFDVCRSLDRSLVGMDGWESPATRGFAASIGMAEKSRTINRRQHLDEVPPSLIAGLYDEAAAHAGDYRLERVAGPSPDGLLEELSLVAAEINDAPLDDLELEDEDYSPERMRAVEDAYQASGQRFYRVLARHRRTGALAGHTVVTVASDTPEHGEQEDTVVAREHRGHRLGLLLKADMVRWLTGGDGGRPAEPALRTIDTYNAESNDLMVGINERLGYRVMGRSLEFQRRI